MRKGRDTRPLRRVWALYREACGAVMGESLYNWHIMAKRYSKYLVRQYKL